MKTTTAKEFQLNSSKILREVAKGTAYQVTFHDKPWVEIRPSASNLTAPRPGSFDAVKDSLAFTYGTTTLPTMPDYKMIRKQNLAKKYAKNLS